MKRPFHGTVWRWHQDFPTYFHDDKMPEPRLVNALVFIDEVREFNGPLMIVPASHKAPAYETAVDDTTTSYPLRAADDSVVAGLAAERGIEAPKGGPGSVIFAHTNIVHGSGPNMSPLAAHARFDHLQLHRQQARPLASPRMGGASRLRDPQADRSADLRTRHRLSDALEIRAKTRSRSSRV